MINDSFLRLHFVGRDSTLLRLSILGGFTSLTVACLDVIVKDMPLLRGAFVGYWLIRVG